MVVDCMVDPPRVSRINVRVWGLHDEDEILFFFLSVRKDDTATVTGNLIVPRVYKSIFHRLFRQACE